MVLVVAILITIAMTAAVEDGARRPDAIAYGLALLMALLLRRGYRFNSSNREGEDPMLTTLRSAHSIDVAQCLGDAFDRVPIMRPAEPEDHHVDPGIEHRCGT